MTDTLTYPPLHSGSPSPDSLARKLGAVAYWPIRETNGTNIADIVGGFDGTVQNTGDVTLGQKPGPIARVLGVHRYAQFGGVSGRIDTANVADNSAIPQTYSMWVKPDVLTKRGYLLMQNNAGNTVTAFFETRVSLNGDLHFGILTSGTAMQAFTGSGTLTAGVWQHVAMAWDGSLTAANVLFYVDGVLQAHTGSDTNGTGVVAAATGSWVVAGRSQDNGRNYDGGLSGVAWFPSVLTQPQINSLYLTGKHGA